MLATTISRRPFKTTKNTKRLSDSTKMMGYSHKSQPSKGASINVTFQTWIPGLSIYQHDYEAHPKGLPDTSGHQAIRGRRNRGALVTQKMKQVSSQERSQYLTLRANASKAIASRRPSRIRHGVSRCPHLNHRQAFMNYSSMRLFLMAKRESSALFRRFSFFKIRKR